MRDIPAIIDTASDRQRVENTVRRAHSELREAVVQEEKAGKRLETAREITQKKRLALGRALVEARKQWPSRGPRARGWGDLLETLGIPQQTAHDLMRLAGYVEEVSPPDQNGGEIPTRREIRDASARRDEQPDPPGFDPDTDGEAPSVIVRTPAARGLDLRLGRWEAELAGVEVDAVITDAPYSATTHTATTTRADGVDAAGLTPTYAAWSETEIDAFVAAWSQRCRGWIVALCDDVLIPVWRAAYLRHGRYAFAPVPCVISGMSVRIQGDGPSSWAVYAMVSRPRDLAKWGTLPGAYTGGREDGASGGRGKPRWLMDALVRDYTREGDLVCDPLAGYGTTLISAVASGRQAIGSEIDADAHAEAMRRADIALQQLRRSA